MSELELYKLEQLGEKVAELEKMGQLIPFGIISFVGLLALGVLFFIYVKSWGSDK